MNFEFYKEHTILDYPEYEFNIEEHRRGEEQFLFAHFAFKTKPNAQILKRVLREWKLFRKCVTAPLYAAYFQDGDMELWKHFVGLLGFKPTGFTIPLNNGVQRPLYIHTVSNDQIEHQLNPEHVALGSAERCAHHGDERRELDVQRDKEQQLPAAV